MNRNGFRASLADHPWPFGADPRTIGKWVGRGVPRNRAVVCRLPFLQPLVASPVWAAPAATQRTGIEVLTPARSRFQSAGGPTHAVRPVPKTGA
jgi:hypothetical protein